MRTGRRIALVVTVVAASFIAAPAVGRRLSPPRGHIACKRIAPGVCEESGNIGLPPDSYGAQSTDTVPSSSAREETVLEPFNRQDLADLDSLWETVAARCASS